MAEDLRDLRDYIEAAKNKLRPGCSDRLLSLALKLGTPQAVHYYRSGKALPSDEVMAKMAEIAGVDPHEALLRLNMWRCERATKKTTDKGAAYQFYFELLQLAKRAAATVLIIMGLGVGVSPVPAHANAAPTSGHAAGPNVYYGKWRRRFGRLTRR